ncbi:MAG: glutaredoxin [Gammaproteobacteria bacterium]|jgi:glutaredoxin
MNPSKIIYLCVATLLLSLQLSLSHAELYKWVDDKGAIHYGDQPPEKANLKKIQGSVSSFKTPDLKQLPSRTKSTSNSSRGQVSVVMYSASWCQYCKKAASHFRRNNIAFEEYDVEKTTKGARDYKKLDGRGVPVILIGSQKMNGFSAAQFDSIYESES